MSESANLVHVRIMLEISHRLVSVYKLTRDHHTLLFAKCRGRIGMEAAVATCIGM